MWRSGLAACGLVLFLGAFPVHPQDDAARRVAEAERRAADAERRASDAERRALEAGATASAGASAPGTQMQKLECQAARRNFQVMCSRRAMETTWEARECATAAAEIHAQCAAQ